MHGKLNKYNMVNHMFLVIQKLYLFQFHDMF